MKDNNNKLDFNQWSCSEYNNNLNGFYVTEVNLYQITKQYSTIGENSLKLINNTNSAMGYRTTPIVVQQDKTYKLTANIYAPISKVNMVLQQEGGSYEYVSVNPSSKPQTVSVTINSDNYSNLIVRFNIYTGYIYIDCLNVSLI